jgi:hypothetical protein
LTTPNTTKLEGFKIEIINWVRTPTLNKTLKVMETLKPEPSASQPEFHSISETTTLRIIKLSTTTTSIPIHELNSATKTHFTKKISD